MDKNIQEYIDNMVRESLKKIKNEKKPRKLSQRQEQLFDKARQIKEAQGGELPWCQCVKLAKYYLDNQDESSDD